VIAAYEHPSTVRPDRAQVGRCVLR
jgi:hypothetical protein